MIECNVHIHLGCLGSCITLSLVFIAFLSLFSVSGGRSRLHLIDLGSCEKVLSKSRDGEGGLCLSLTALGNVILALANGAKHVPYR